MFRIRLTPGLQFAAGRGRPVAIALLSIAINFNAKRLARKRPRSHLMSRLRVVRCTRFLHMNLARYKSFVNRLHRDTGLSKVVNKIDVFRLSAEIWYDVADQQITDPRSIRSLKNTLGWETHWRLRKSNIAYFPVPSLDMVIVATFPAPPRSTTRQRFCDNIQACLTGSNNEYDASHDHLTGLINRAEFDRLLSEEVRHLNDANSPRLSGPENTGPNESILLLAIDIDYFKIVNDSFGHQYGDFVLRCIARRFDDQCTPRGE